MKVKSQTNRFGQRLDIIEAFAPGFFNVIQYWKNNRNTLPGDYTEEEVTIILRWHVASDHELTWKDDWQPFLPVLKKGKPIKPTIIPGDFDAS